MENFNLNETAIGYLQVIKRWTRIISIIMFVMIGIMLVFGIVMAMAMKSITATEMQGMPFGAGTMAIMYVLIAALYFFPVYYLYKFSQHLENALYTRNEEELTISLHFLKSHYNIVGILLIAGIVLMILAFVAAIFGALVGLGAAAGGGEIM